MTIPERLKNNLGLKLFSMAVALLIWGLVHNQADPLVMRHRALPVEAIEVPDKLAVATIDPAEVTVTLFGRASAFEPLEYSNFRLVANVAGAPVGVQTVPVTPVGLPAGLEIRQLSRTMVRVELDSIISATRPVFAEMSGEPAPGFAVAGSSVTPASVTVVGPSSKVQAVARVVAEVDVSGRNATVPATVLLSARDASSVAVAGVHAEPAQATVTVQIKQVNSKTVPIVPIIANVPAGYEVSNISVKPMTVTLTGGGVRLSAVNAVQTAALNLNGQPDGGTFNINLRLPDGVTAIGGGAATVTIELRRSTPIAGPQPERSGAATSTSPPPEPTQTPETAPEPAPPATEPQPAPTPPTKPVPPPGEGHPAAGSRSHAPAQPEPSKTSHAAPGATP